jgi:4-hydroxy-tetrahydrodipicolinate reductase
MKVKLFDCEHESDLEKEINNFLKDDKIEIKHTLFSRRALALGAVVAAEFIASRKGVFTIDDLFE